MAYFERLVYLLSRWCNRIAQGAVVAMMLMLGGNILLRFIGTKNSFAASNTLYSFWFKNTLLPLAFSMRIGKISFKMRPCFAHYADMKPRPIIGGQPNKLNTANGKPPDMLKED